MPMSRSMLKLFAVLIAAGTVGCTQFPELEDRFADTSRRAAYPDLVPAETLRADLVQERIALKDRQRVDARIGKLRGRAAALRGTVIDSASRARLSQPVTLPDPS